MPDSQPQQSNDRRDRQGDFMGPNLEHTHIVQNSATPADHLPHPSGDGANHHLISSVARDVQPFLGIFAGQDHSALSSSLQSSLWPSQFPSVQQLSFSVASNLHHPARVTVPNYGPHPAQSTAGIAMYRPSAAPQADPLHV